MFRDSWPKSHPLEPRTPVYHITWLSTPPPPPGNSTRNLHVLNHTSEEITIFAPKSFGQLNMRCCTILHGLTLFLRPRTSSLLTRTTVRRSKVLWMSSEVSLYKCTHTHTHTHILVNTAKRGLFFLFIPRNFTTNRFHGMTMDFSYQLLCMCEHQLSNHGPTPTPHKVHGCKAVSNTFLFDLTPNHGMVFLAFYLTEYNICVK